MHSYQRPRGKILFEVLCALSLAASFAGAWDQTGSSALLASAAIIALFAIYWAFGLFARNRLGDVAQPTAAVVEAQEAEVVTAVPAEVFTRELAALPEPEPVAAAPKKRPVRKVRKAAPVVAPEPAAIEEPVSDAMPVEQLFDPQPFVRQPRAFGRKSRGPRPLPAA